jgi:hypothetical protein
MNKKSSTTKRQVRAAPVGPGQRVGLYVGVTLAGVAGLFFIAICGGDAMEPLRHYLGLDYFLAEEQGVYADCSKPSNHKNRFCRRDYSSPVRRYDQSPSWERPDNGLPFTLYETH